MTTFTQGHFYRERLPLPYLEESGLASLAHGVDPVLVEAAGRGDGGVVVGPLAAVHGPVVVAVVVDVAVAVVHETVGALLLGQGPVRALEIKRSVQITEIRSNSFCRISIDKFARARNTGLISHFCLLPKEF